MTSLPETKTIVLFITLHKSSLTWFLCIVCFSVVAYYYSCHLSDTVIEL